MSYPCVGKYCNAVPSSRSLSVKEISCLNVIEISFTGNVATFGIPPAKNTPLGVFV